MARKFVVKHIRSKQEEKLQAEKERVGGGAGQGGVRQSGGALRLFQLEDWGA